MERQRELHRTVSSSSFGIHSEMIRQDYVKRIQRRKRQINIGIALVTLLLAACMICLVLLHVANTRQDPTTAKIKKVVLNDRPEQLDGIQSLHLMAPQNQSAQDVVLLPEDNHLERMDEYPNHRPTELALESKQQLLENLMQTYYAHGWDASTQQHNTTQRFNNIQDIIRHYERQDERMESSSVQGSNSKEAAHHVVPFRLKGVYMQPTAATPPPPPTPDLLIEPPKQADQINQLLATPKIVGSPFKLSQISPSRHSVSPGVAKVDGLYTKAFYHPYDKTQSSREMKKKWTQDAEVTTEVIQRKKPLIVMLDIYPMTKPDKTRRRRPEQDVAYIPLRPGQQVQPLPARHVYRYLVPPNQRQHSEEGRKRMMMQLNLFPKRVSRQDREFYHPRTDARIGEVFHEPTRMSRRTFSLFKKKDKDPCDIIGHNPYGKPIAAKWKNKNGEWIHAKIVELKQWDDEGFW